MDGPDDPKVHPIARGLLGLVWLNGLLFWLVLFALSIFALAVGDTTARVIGAAVLLLSVLGAVGMFRRR